MISYACSWFNNFITARTSFQSAGLSTFAQQTAVSDMVMKRITYAYLQAYRSCCYLPTYPRPSERPTYACMFHIIVSHSRGGCYDAAASVEDTISMDKNTEAEDLTATFFATYYSIHCLLCNMTQPYWATDPLHRQRCWQYCFGLITTSST